MNKPKNIIYSLIGLLITIIVVLMFVKIYNEKCYWQRQVAEYNYTNWGQIYHMTHEIEKKGFTQEGIKEVSLYINAKVSATEPNLSPGFSSSPESSFFLQTYYLSLALDISKNREFDAEELQLAINLFEEATIELRKLSATILEMTSSSYVDNRLELISTDSELYKQVDKMVKEYGNKYSEKISNFYSDLEN